MLTTNGFLFHLIISAQTQYFCLFIFMKYKLTCDLQRQLEIYKLEPNTSYAFRIWAVNQLGKGEITELISRTIYHDEEGGKCLWFLFVIKVIPKKLNWIKIIKILPKKSGIQRKWCPSYIQKLWLNIMVR